MGNFLVVQLLGLHAFTAEGLGLIPSRGSKIPQTAWRGQNKNKTKIKKKTLVYTSHCAHHCKQTEYLP